jgi:hypothetical protein
MSEEPWRRLAGVMLRGVVVLVLILCSVCSSKFFFVFQDDVSTVRGAAAAADRQQTRPGVLPPHPGNELRNPVGSGLMPAGLAPLLEVQTQLDITRSTPPPL